MCALSSLDLKITFEVMFRARGREIPLKGDHRSEDWGAQRTSTTSKE